MKTEFEADGEDAHHNLLYINGIDFFNTKLRSSPIFPGDTDKMLFRKLVYYLKQKSNPNRHSDELWWPAVEIYRYVFHELVSVFFNSPNI